MKRFLVTTLFLFSATTFAQESLFTDFQNHCSLNVCKAPFSKITLYQEGSSENTIDAQLLVRLRAKSLHQAQIWGDTILEGDYAAVGPTIVRSVEALYKNSELIGYHLFYYEKAWFLGNCDSTDNRYETCEEGIIEEAVFLTPDLRVESDPLHRATFQEETGS